VSSLPLDHQGALDWSPDETRVVFSIPTPSGDSEAGNLYIVRADGSGVEQLTATTLYYGFPAWGP